MDKYGKVLHCANNDGKIIDTEDSMEEGRVWAGAPVEHAVSGAAVNRAVDDINMPGLSGKSVVSVVVTKNERSENH